MNSYIGCFGLLGIAGFIVLLFLRRKRVENDMTLFYQAHSLYRTENEPPNVRENLDAASDNLFCCRANLKNVKGENVEFCWWEWYLKSNTMINGVPSVSFAHYLAVTFAPNSVSDDFIKKALLLADQSADSAAQKVKDFFVADTQNPYRAEILMDGTLIICWQVAKRRDVYEAKIEWLKSNVSPPSVPKLVTPEKVQDVMQNESKVADIIAPEESKITAPDELETAGTVFYTHDSYAILRRKFNSSWTNLQLELHHRSAKFQHEGYDEFDSDATFGDPNIPNKIAFTLTGETIVRTAAELFSEHFGGETYILRDGTSSENLETLRYCNNPFRLPLDEYTYGEFKRRFSERWTNLSIELYTNSPHKVGEPQTSGELADVFDMKTLKNAEKAFLGDYVYISDWSDKLAFIRIAARIKNEKCGICSVGNYARIKLKEFNEADNSESLRRMSVR